MKKTIALLTLLLILPVSVSAQGNSEAARERASENRVERTNDRFVQAIARIGAKLDARISRYEGFVEKLQTKRNMLSEKGGDMTEVDRLIRLAEDQMNETKATVNASKANLEAIDTSLTPREIFQEVSSLVREVRASFRELHLSMVEVVEELGVVAGSLEDADSN